MENRFYNSFKSGFKSYFDGIDDEPRPKRRQMLSFSRKKAELIDSICSRFNVDPTSFIKASVDHMIDEVIGHPSEFKDVVQIELEKSLGLLKTVTVEKTTLDRDQILELRRAETLEATTVWDSLTPKQKADFNRELLGEDCKDLHDVIKSIKAWPKSKRKSSDYQIDFDSAWNEHAMAEIARAYRKDTTNPGGMASAAALATVAALTDVSTDDKGAARSVRFQALVIAPSGAGKTTIADAMQDVCATYGVVGIATCGQGLKWSLIAADKDGAKKGIVRSILGIADGYLPPRPARKIEREIFLSMDEKFIINDRLLRVHYTGTAWITPSQYAREPSPVNAGLEFWEPDKPNLTATAEIRLRKQQRAGETLRLHEPAPDTLEELIEIVDQSSIDAGETLRLHELADKIHTTWSEPGAKIRVTDATDDAMTPIYKRLLSAGLSENGAYTAIFNTAALFAAARIALKGAPDHEITECDVYAASAVLERTLAKVKGCKL